MSRVGKQPVKIPSGVSAEVQGQKVKVSGKLGELEMNVHSSIGVNKDDSEGVITVTNDRPNERRFKQLHGTMRALISNMITGVTEGFSRKMEVYGTGYNVKEQGGKLVLQVGYCHPVEFKIPEGITVNIETPATRGNEVPARFTLTGTNKDVLGQFAANVRGCRPPEPYKGKGVRYADEYVQRKVGKAFASGAM